MITAKNNAEKSSQFGQKKSEAYGKLSISQLKLVESLQGIQK